MQDQNIQDSGYLLRVVAMFLAGCAIAGLLTWFMYALIQFGEQRMDESARVHILDFVRLQRNESSERKQRKPERPEVEKAPPVPQAPDSNDLSSDMNALAISDIPLDGNVDVDTDGFGFGSGEGEFLPIVKVAPIYPVSASSRGIEGICVVEYTVTTTGSTRNISVVEGRCDHSSFRRPSIAAASRFKYKPRIINGEAVEVERVQNIFTYVLENQGARDE